MTSEYPHPEEPTAGRRLEGCVQMFDSTVVRAHVSAAGAKGGKTSALAESRCSNVFVPGADKFRISLRFMRTTDSLYL
jgi:hypothetical protein